MLSYLNDPAIKAKYLRRARAHYKADEIVQGRYWQNGKGCNIGCVTHCNDGAHAAWAKEIGPEWLARLGDTLFEGLPLDRAKEFVVEFHRAIPVGVDLEPVRWKFALVLLRENRERVLSLKEINDELRKQVVAAIDGVIRVNESAIVTGKWDESSRSAARSARSAAWSAWSAAWSAAESAESAARSAAWSAAESARSAAWSARSAAWSAAESAWSAAESAESAARSAAYIRYVDALLRLLRHATKGGAS